MRICDWSSYVCSSDRPRRDRPTRPDPEEALACAAAFQDAGNLADIAEQRREHVAILVAVVRGDVEIVARLVRPQPRGDLRKGLLDPVPVRIRFVGRIAAPVPLKLDGLIPQIGRAPSELQSLMRNSYSVVCLQKKNNN